MVCPKKQAFWPRINMPPNHTRTGKYCSEGYLDMCRCVGLGSEGFVAQHLTQYMKWKLEIEGGKMGGNKVK